MNKLNITQLTPKDGRTKSYRTPNKNKKYKYMYNKPGIFLRHIVCIFTLHVGKITHSAKHFHRGSMHSIMH